MGSIEILGILGNWKTGEATGSHRNTWESIGIPCNWEAGEATGSHRNTWDLLEYVVTVSLGTPLGAIGILGISTNIWNN